MKEITFVIFLTYVFVPHCTGPSSLDYKRKETGNYL